MRATSVTVMDGHGSRYVLILSSRLYTKHHETKISKGALKTITREATPHFKEYSTKIDDISLTVMRFFFSQTQFLKSNSVFIDIFDSFCHSLFIFLHFDFYLYSRDFEVRHDSTPFLKKQ